MDKITIKAPAKINLGLNVIEKRNDGYHNIETIFYPIHLCDELYINRAEKTSFKCSDKNLPIDKSNLVIKAISKFEQYVQQSLSVEIYLEKKIPVGAGLGGGSSDAAAVLLGLNELFNYNLKIEELRKLAFSIGSDVPFFIKPLPAFACSRGEELRYINLKIDKPILIVHPGISVSTIWAYSKVTPRKPQQSLFELSNIDLDDRNMINLISNDFESVVFQEFPEIKQIKQSLLNHAAMFALMSGSGSSVFGIFANINQAIEVKNTLPNNYFTFLHYENN